MVKAHEKSDEASVRGLTCAMTEAALLRPKTARTTACPACRVTPGSADTPDHQSPLFVLPALRVTACHGRCALWIHSQRAREQASRQERDTQRYTDTRRQIQTDRQAGRQAHRHTDRGHQLGGERVIDALDAPEDQV
jgi:hypothetical protein